MFKDESMLSGMLTNGDINDLVPKARAALRSYSVTPHNAAKEFHKLALECGASPDGAAYLRKSILSVRSR
jgi:superfamily II RNA helicase